MHNDPTNTKIQTDPDPLIKKDNRFKEELKHLPLEVRAEMAMKEAVAEAIARHKRLGNPIAVWKRGKAVWIAPEDIVVPEKSND
jgi:hypothetical protein